MIHKKIVHEFLEMIGEWATKHASEIKLRLFYKMDNKGRVPVPELKYYIFGDQVLWELFVEAYPEFV